MATNKSGIIYLHRDGFQIYSPYFTTMLEFRFVPEIVRDLEVINKELLENLLKLFVTNSKIPPSNMMIVLADSAAFIKDFVPQLPQQPQPGQPPAAPQQDQKTIDDLRVQADQFIEHVPFEDVVSKTVPWNNGLRVFAVNQEFYETIKKAFEKNGFTVDTVMPGFLLGNTISTSNTITVQLAASLPEKINSLRQNNLLTQIAYQPERISKENTDVEVEIDEPEGPHVEMGMPKGKEKKRLFIMVGVFAVLIVVLVIVYMQSQQPIQPEQQNPTSSTQQPIAAALPIATAVPTSPAIPTVITTVPPTLETKSLTVQIINTPASVRSAQSVKVQLDKYGFKSVLVQNQPAAGASTSFVTFSAKPNPTIRASVIEEVRKIVGDVTIQEKKDNKYDIEIVLAK